MVWPTLALRTAKEQNSTEPLCGAAKNFFIFTLDPVTYTSSEILSA